MNFPHISDEEIEKAAEEYALYLKQKKKEKLEFVNKWVDTLNAVYEHLKNDKIIDNEDLSYFPENYSFSFSDFNFLFDALLDFACENNIIGKEINNPFENFTFFLQIHDLKIVGRRMHGQGTSEQLWVSDEGDDWKPELAFNPFIVKAFFKNSI